MALLRGLSRVITACVAAIVLVLLGFRGAAAIRESRPRGTAAPSGGKFVHAADVDMFVQEAGPDDGVPVVLIHGTGAWSEIWRATLDTLAAEGFHAIALDMPPFGYSQRPASADYGDAAQAKRILGVIEALRLPQVVLVGHSFGARPTVEAVLRAPSLVRSLVLVDAALDLHMPATVPPSGPSVVRVAPPSIRNALVAATLTNPLLTRRLLQTLIARDEAATTERVQMLQRPFTVLGTTAAFGEWLVPFVTVRERSLATDPKRIHSLRMPALVIWGDRDEITPLAQGRELAALLPNAQLKVLRGVGHIPAIEASGAFNGALVEFLRPLESQERSAQSAEGR
ncbi:MAG TPA: alpha/beta hydrolase [Gemmatimonadaceae bacterium]|jgi:pimeloyl-ACP methyl ester carboxylesterase